MEHYNTYKTTKNMRHKISSLFIGCRRKKRLIIATLTILSCINLGLAQDSQQPPIFVDVVTVKPTTRQDQVATTGTLIAIPGIVVKPEISGRITKIYFKSGDTITAETPLIEINTDVLNAQLAKAQAQAQLTRLQYARYSQLYKTHDISKADFDKAQADYNSAQASVANIQAQLRQANITAPFTGKLGLSQINIGDYINVGQSIVNLQALDPLKVDFSVPEIYLSKVTIGQTVLLKTDAYPNTTFTGKVEAIESLINDKNRTLGIRANVPNKEGKLLPGAFVETTLQLASQKNLLIIPQTAIVYAPAGNYVFKVINGKAKKTAVVLGAMDNKKVVITSGIKADDVIVTAGQQKIHDGAPVIITKPKK